jgi:hypothetical protein
MVGLPLNTELGVGIGYFETTSKSQALSINDGASNPVLLMNKIWGADSSNFRTKAGISVTPRTSNSTLKPPTLYSLGGSATRLLDKNLTASIGMTRNIYNRDKYYDNSSVSDFTVFSAGFSNHIGPYLLSTSVSAARSDSKQLEYLGHSEKSKKGSIYSSSFTLSQPLIANVWLGFSYTYSWQHKKEQTGSAGSDVSWYSPEFKSRTHKVMVTIQSLF